jgi:hypothetical protein
MTTKSTNIKDLFKWAHEAFIGRIVAVNVSSRLTKNCIR